MKWTGTTAKATGTSLSSLSRGRLISALMHCSAKKRKHENGPYHQARRRVTVYENAVVNDCAAHEAQKRRTFISSEELWAIQTQLAVLSDGDGDRPIHIEVTNENLKLVQKLCLLMVNNSISLDLTNHLRQTPLHLAVMLSNIEITKLLLSFGASPLVSDRNGNSVLHLAVKSVRSSKEMMQLLLSQSRVKNIMDSMDYEGYTPLHYAVFKNNSVAVEVLHSCGADVNKIDGKSGRTALIHAVLEQNIDMVDLLLNYGACPEKIDYSGKSAFEMALQITNPEITKLLEKRMSGNEVTDVTKHPNKSSVQHSAKKSTKRTIKSRK